MQKKALKLYLLFDFKAIFSFRRTPLHFHMAACNVHACIRAVCNVLACIRACTKHMH